MPHGHWKTLTFIAGLKHDGIIAPYVFDDPINGDFFTAWVEQCLIPAMKPGMIAVMDNLGSHKGRRVRELLRKAGIKLFFLPPYSPDLNPIEEVFAKALLSLSKGSNASYARPTNAPSRPLGGASANCWIASRQTNVQTTSGEQGMPQSKSERL